MFRDNAEEAKVAQMSYETGLGAMRRVLIPQSDTMRFSDGIH